VTRPPRRARVASAVFVLATRLLPATFRGSALGEDMRRAFADEAADVCRTGGTPALVRATAGAILDVVGFAIRSRGQRASSSAIGPARVTPRSAGVFIRGLWQDARYGARILRRRPGFALVAVTTLAVGIGATSSVFTVVNAALLRPLPYPHADRLVRIWGSRAGDPGARANLNPLDAADWRRGVASFDGLGVWTTATESRSGGGDPALVNVAFASSGLFETLGATAARGRLFGPRDDRPGHESDVVITDRFWHRALGGDPDVIGRTLILAGRTCHIIGLLPRGFASPGAGAAHEPDVWRPYVITPDTNRGGHFMQGIARLAPGATLQQAQDEIDAISATLAAEYPATNVGKSGLLEPLQQAITGDARPALLLLMAAVGAVLLMTCANVAILLLARGVSRQPELALRAALGAGRARVTSQLLLEGLLMAGSAGAGGIGLAVCATRLLPSWLTDEVPTVMALRVDERVIAFTLLVALATTLVFGLMPALRAARINVRGTLAGTAGAGTCRPRRLQTGLLVLETALALMLLVSATLLIESFVRLRDVDPGFDAAHVMTFRVSLPDARYPTTDARRVFFDDLAARIGGLPGVTAAGGINMAPLTGRYSCDSFGLAGRPAPPRGLEPCAESRIATPEYFRAMGIPLVAGRGLEATDVAGREPVIVVNQSLARHYWPRGRAVGQRFKWGNANAGGPWRTIVGVVGDVKHFGLDVKSADEVYMPLAQVAASALTIAARTDRAPATLVADLRHTVAGLDATLPVSEVASGRDLIDRSTAVPQFLTELTVVFAAVALGLALLGVYGLMSFFVAQRTREIGIRMALGARAHEVRRLVVRRGMTAVAAGVACGLAAALAFTQLLGSLLFGVTPTDWHAFVLAAAALGVAAFAAAYFPARRATRVDPLAVMRAE
jgi:putative ABC transport system permease protein